MLVHALVPGLDHFRAPLDSVERDDVGTVDVRKQVIRWSAIVCMIVSVVVVMRLFAAVMTVVIVVRHDSSSGDLSGASYNL